MALIADLKKFVYDQEIKYRSSVSESTWYKIGGAINFILNRNHQEKQFFVNGYYSTVVVPYNSIDGLTVFNFDAEIFNVYMFCIGAGDSGDTELDLRIKPQNSGAFTSIFTVKPKINYQAGGPVWVGIGDTIAHCTAPVLTSGPSPLLVNKGDAITMDMIQRQGGQARSCGLLVHYRPR